MQHLPPSMPILPGFPEAPSVRLARTPLKSMLCQIKFPLRSEFATAAAPSKVQELLAGKLPRLLEEPQATLLLGPTGVQTQSSTVWRLTTFDKTWSVVLGQDTVTFETTAYVDWRDLRARFAEALEAVMKVVPISARERVGLRYVNEVRAGVNPSWADFMNPELLGWTGNPKLTQDLAQHVSEARFAVEEYLAIFRYGLIRPAIPSTEAQPPFYLLDIDCSDNRAAPFELGSTLDTLDRFNEAIWRLFRWSLADAYFEQLKDGN